MLSSVTFPTLPQHKMYKIPSSNQVVDEIIFFFQASFLLTIKQSKRQEN